MRIRAKQMSTRPYGDAVVWDGDGNAFHALPLAFGRFAGNTASVLIPTVAIDPVGVAFNVNPPGNDPQQTMKDFQGGDKPNLGSSVPFTGVSSTLLSNLTKYLGYADQAAQNGYISGPLAAAGAQWVKTLNADAQNCVLYQNNDAGSGLGEDFSGRSTAQNQKYSAALHQMQTDMASAVAALLKADAQEAAYEAGQGANGVTAATGPTYTPAAPSGATYVPANAASGGPAYVPQPSAASGATTIFGLDPTTALIGAAGLGLVVFLLMKKPARAVAPPPPPVA